MIANSEPSAMRGAVPQDRDVINLFSLNQAREPRASDLRHDYIFLGDDQPAAREEAIRRELTRAIEDEIGRLQSELQAIASSEMESSPDAKEMLRSQIQGLEGLKSTVATAGPTQLAGLSQMMGPAGGLVAGALGARSHASALAAVSLAEHLGDHFDNYLEMSRNWSDTFRRELSTFEQNVAAHGINHALKESNYSYHNAGVADMYMWKNNTAGYRDKTVALDERYEAREKSSAKDMQGIERIAQANQIDTSAIDKQIAALESEIADHEKNPKGFELLRQQQAELEQLRLQKMQLLREQLQIQIRELESSPTPDQEAISAKREVIGQIDSTVHKQQSRVDDAMAAWDAQVEAHIEGLQELGVDEKIIERTREDYKTEREIIAEEAERNNIKYINRNTGHVSDQAQKDIEARRKAREAQSNTSALGFNKQALDNLLTTDNPHATPVAATTQSTPASLGFDHAALDHILAKTSLPLESTQSSVQAQPSDPAQPDAIEAAVAKIKGSVAVDGDATTPDGPSSSPSTKRTTKLNDKPSQTLA